MTAIQNPQDLVGRTVVDSSGDKIGKVGQVYINDQSGQPEWLTVSTGMFGSKESFVPLYGSDTSGEQIIAGVSKDVVKDAPNIDPDGHTDEGEQQALYDYYAGQLGWDTSTDEPQASEQSTDPDGQSGVEGRDTSGPTTDDAMTRSEERMNVGTETVEAGRARLRKYVVTENVTTTVPVSHEEVRLEREPITDANRDSAMAGGDITEEEHEVTLQAERPVVTTETVPVERVRLGKETVTEQQEVSGQIRKEQIDDPTTEKARTD